MPDFSDHLEDINEETDEFEDALEVELEDVFGVEFDVTQVRRDQRGQVTATVQPAGIPDHFGEKFGADVQVRGGFQIDFQ